MANNDIFDEIKKFSVDTAATCMNMLNKLVKLNDNKMENKMEEVKSEVKTDAIVEDAAVVSEDAAVVSEAAVVAEDVAVVSEDTAPVVEIPVNLDGEISLSGVDTTGNDA